MKHNSHLEILNAILTIVILAVMLVPIARAQSTYKVLHKFKGPDGANPYAGLTLDAAGNLYGIAQNAGDCCGTIFKLDTARKFSVVHVFEAANNASGWSGAGYPTGGVLVDSEGNLYGSTEVGPNIECDYGWWGSCGALFKLDTVGKETDYNLSPSDGWVNAALISDAAGNHYGTAMNACGNQYPIEWGTVFKVDPNFNVTNLYVFDVGDFIDGKFTKAADGACPMGNLVLDKAGNLYGTAFGNFYGDYFAAYIASLVFKLTPNADGTWTRTVLHTFTGNDGDHPYAGLVFDAGNLYGTTVNGGGSANCPDGCGVVFKLTPMPDGTWQESVLHRFTNHPAAHPYAGLVFDKAGNLYGTTVNGGSADGGTVFKMTPDADGTWAFRVLHTFNGTPALHPYGTLVLDQAGNLYGTTSDCSTGTGGTPLCYGVVFEITP